MNAYFYHLHPFVTFLYYVGTIILIMFMQHPISLSAVFFLILLVHYVQDRFRSVRRWGVLILSSGLLVFLINPLFNERGQHLLFEILNHRFTLEAIVYGGMTALTIMSIIALFVSYNEVMTPNKLLYLFSKFLPQFAVLLMLTLRFIPLMKRRLDEITAVQQSKGISVVEGTWRQKAKNGLLYVQVLVTYSLEEAIQTADSMKARGYGRKQRSSYEHYRLKRGDICSMAILVFLFCLTLIGRLMGYGYIVVYPVMDSLSLTMIEMYFLTGFLLFVSFPLMIEGGGYIKWRISSVKM
ncbi:energy-coupling factor transporter transmembrane protein EcfT [Alkalihalobacillus sp. MEB130]|uniref:energy-coupling factor transporter transmembrane component T n=1 Tax=Alkalihalobacillus sp. MEB130 TaxID=2976704 RepID=UPI0028DF588C|nr:energy-coupling factor transporter transmembrane component T [Alkalihalobacillus sp. MEB130]MDT8859755.1 energy-coupling factor transporter transmembrane protein EcfT [Alkalihalobacillus sp. MEB130]